MKHPHYEPTIDNLENFPFNDLAMAYLHSTLDLSQVVNFCQVGTEIGIFYRHAMQTETLGWKPEAIHDGMVYCWLHTHEWNKNLKIEDMQDTLQLSATAILKSLYRLEEQGAIEKTIHKDGYRAYMWKEFWTHDAWLQRFVYELYKLVMEEIADED